MGLVEAIGFCLLWATLTQITFTNAQDCKITSITSPAASSLIVKWDKYIGATNYFLDLRLVNSTDTAPIVISLPVTSTEKEVQGLKPGTVYSVTLKVFEFYFVRCSDIKTSITVPATSQITLLKALSSTSIKVEWARVPTAEQYHLVVNTPAGGVMLNLTSTNTSAVVGKLRPQTRFDCYVQTANSGGLGSGSTVRTVYTLVQPPSGIILEQTGPRTARLSWQPVDKVLLYTVSLKNLDKPNSTPFVTNVTDTNINLQDLFPCSSYMVSVASVNAFLEPGEPSDLNFTTNPLNPVTSITVDNTCLSGSASVSWGTVFGAISYRAVAVGQNGTVLSCTSQTPQCQITGVTCGQSYTVHVTALSETCESTTNTTSHFETVPCSPKNPQLYRECSSNVIIFSWAHTNYTNYYIAKAVDSKGEKMECMTKDNSCFFTDTMCGRSYTFTVYSVSGQCNGKSSSAVEIQTAPCMPTNIKTSSGCQLDGVISTWDRAEGALSYTMEAWGTTGNHNYYNCSTLSNSCSISGIGCGEHLTIYVTALDNNCPSSRALGQEAETVPCIPQNISASMRCGVDSISMSWGLTNGAVFYIATAVDTSGVNHTLNTISTQCQFEGLRCGSIYTTYVIATNLKCNSSYSEIVFVETASCPPDHIEATLNCAENQAQVMWQGHSSNASYTAMVEDTSGGLLSCSTIGNHCKIPSLKCGQLYTLTVSQQDGMCPSRSSQAVFMESVPCGPSNVYTQVDCGSRMLTVGWNVSARAEGYTTVITHSNGQQTYCNSTEPQCSVRTLQCGEEYAVEVKSFNDTCFSMPSQAKKIKEVPCAPTNMRVTRTCTKNSVTVNWTASKGAENYTALAVSLRGHLSKCSSNETTCSFSDLQCGQVYNVSVMAVDSACSSLKSGVVSLQTVPCPPTQVTGTGDCANNSVSLTWNVSDNAIGYSARAAGSDGHNVSCDNVSPRCQLGNLHCGQKYVFTVSASDGVCQSPDSQGFMYETAPCPPQNVSKLLNCWNNTLNVSWNLGSNSQNYSATAVARNGTALSCTTGGSSCEVYGLQCGQQYTVTVKAGSSKCQGPSSTSQIVQTVPCTPANIHGDMTCASNTLSASWTAAAGALGYISRVTGPGGYTASWSAAKTNCSFLGLQCAQLYRLSVVAYDSQCNSSASAVVSMKAAPCDPQNVTAYLQCSSGMVSVSWQASAGAAEYTVLAMTNGQAGFTSCHSNNTSCDLPQLMCGRVYKVTVLAGDGTCNSTTLTTTSIKTAPCPPAIQSHSLNCASNIATVSWAENSDSVGFLINATSTLGHSIQCSSTNTSCVLSNLLCGQTYVVYGVTRGNQCRSMPSAPFEIVTAPCVPANVVSKYICGSSTALLSWDETLGRETFFVRFQSGTRMDYRSTNKTSCYLTSLMCGQVYNVSVDAVAGHCNSSHSADTQIQTAPCAPENVSASLVCTNNTAVVTWIPSSGAVGYNVTALARDGDTKRCITNGTSCDLPRMHCAQTYEITVTPFSLNCKGFNTTVTFIAGPCPPSSVQVSLRCNGNVGSVSWVPALLADFYVATATSMDGSNYTCRTNGTGCSFSGLKCGTSYAVTVVTTGKGCQSEPSAPGTLNAAICPPTNLSGVTACGTNDLTISWNRSPNRGSTYILYSQQNGGANTSYSTMATSYVISGLQCGKHFTFMVTAQDSVCTSIQSSNISIDTAPCPPTNLTVQAKCGTNTGILTWNPSAGGVTYIASVKGAQGTDTSCSSSSPSCVVKLDCGNQYSAVVMASNAACNSSLGKSIVFDSAPCLPSNVVANLNCNANTFGIQWSESGKSSDVSFTALAIGSDGSRSTCNTSTTACTIKMLRCGLTYSIAVTTSSVDCGHIDGSDYQIQSAPCKLENPQVNLVCSTNEAMLTWQNSGPDQLNEASAVGHHGVATTCNSTSSNCTFSQLACGEAFTFSVVGYTKQCHSAPSTTANLLAAPCVPTHLTANVDCDTGITVVTWDSALGATGYTVFARGSGGYNDTCVNTDTTCSFPNLACGQDYNITVVANHNLCVSLASEPITASTGPCPHSGLQSSLNCSTNTVLISWTPGRGILSYIATADAFDISHILTCSTAGSGCNISSLRCGERYRLSVRGEGRTCPSPSRNWAPLISSPCPPTQLSIQSSCASNNISVSWAVSQGSVSYMAVAESRKGHWLSCNTSSTTCSITGLLCGQEYEVSSAGVDEHCVGAKSEVKLVRTAPCVPVNVQNDLQCLAGALNVTWQQSDGALHYHATMQDSQGHVSVCDTQELTCVFPNMVCSQIYSVVVGARDNACNSSLSSMKQVTAAPCPPDSIRASVDCTTSVISVTWNSSVAGVLYTVAATTSNGQRYTCNATQTGCDLRALPCGTQLNVTITPSRNGCVGVSSQVQMVRTVPCIPRLNNVEMDCLSDSAWVMWKKSAGAEFYVAVATDSQGQKLKCNTTDSTCAVPGLLCGRNYSFTVMASNQQCSSAPSNTVMSETAPCTPKDVKTMVGCKNRTVSVSWVPSYGALMYTATLERTDGETTCCITNDTSCDIAHLPCGEMYVLLVAAEGRTCNSSQSTGIIVRTEPCVPQELHASLSCSSNKASMTWNNSQGGQRYVVMATATDGHQDQCSSYDSKCELNSLHCGHVYTASVVAQDSTCTSSSSNSVEIRTVPCTPASVWTTMKCGASSLTVSWTQSAGADSYLATLQDSDGYSTNCQAMDQGHCNITGLSCGQLYHVTVVSSDGYCNSPASNVTDTYSAPCPPREITAVMDCESRTAMVSWYMAQGAVSYSTIASTTSGHVVTCITNNTNCDLVGLACGHSYSVAVQAQRENCSSIAQMARKLDTYPCVPEHLTTEYSLTIGQVVWDISLGATSYTAAGVTDQGLTTTCASTDSFCTMYNMACSQVYSITVSAQNSVCQNVNSNDSISIKTEPCPPNNVHTSLNCKGGVAAVSWERSFGAVGYVAYLDGRDGHSLSYPTNETSCTVKGLHCGTVYYTRVTALGESLNSRDSDRVLLVSAPCEAGDVKVKTDCDSDTAQVSWSWSEGAQSYILTATSSDSSQASCNTTENNCNLTKLACGQTYNLSLTATNDNCQVETATGVSFNTRPCSPLRVGVDLQCGTHTAVLSWEQEDGVKFYTASAIPSINSSMALQCNSTEASCRFSGLDCGEVYSFTVMAHSSLCHSVLSSTLKIKTEPCQPKNMTAQGSCGNDMVTLGWWAARGATAYVVTVVGDLGYMTMFETNSTTLETPLPCGQKYSFTALSKDERCASPSSNTATFKTAPCIPQQVQTYIQCENNMGSISWAASEGAESYTAIAVGRYGRTYMCTTNTTSCTWNNLNCGNLYVIQVIADDYMCSSSQSNSTTIRTAPCVPQNLKTSLDCSTKVGSLSWNASDAANLYIVAAESNSGHKVELSTNDTYTLISDFQCGQEYFLSVQALDPVCRSVPSPPARLNSAPCEPQNIAAVMECSSYTGRVSWKHNDGMSSYQVVAIGPNGLLIQCNSTRDSCRLPGMTCGQVFDLTVVAQFGRCDSSTTYLTLQSAPCSPTNVLVSPQCPYNRVSVTWDQARGAASYQAVGITADGHHSAVCNSSNSLTQCDLTNLYCGKAYNLTVLAQDSTCLNIQSQSVFFRTAPCTTQNVSVDMQCGAGSLMVKWSPNPDVSSFRVEAMASNGTILLCNSTDTNCSFKKLPCGQTYSVTVTSTSNSCVSKPSTAVQVSSAPCVPQNLEGHLDCGSSSVWMSWAASEGAQNYTVFAQAAGFLNSSCTTSATTCNIADLSCGTLYNFSMIAVNAQCQTRNNTIVQIETDPCSLKSVTAVTTCDSSKILVGWERTLNSPLYLVTAEGLDKSVISCNSSSTSCLLKDARCSMEYEIIVSSSSDKCSSLRSPKHMIRTVPCTPQDVKVVASCKNHGVVVSWASSIVAQSYDLTAKSRNGDIRTCTTSANNCTMTDLDCGQSYNFSMTASANNCTSPPSVAVPFSTVPCEPSVQSVAFQCESNSAVLSWKMLEAAVDYIGYARSENGDILHCQSMDTSCTIKGLNCGSMYNFTVQASNRVCNSTVSEPLLEGAAPCAPATVKNRMQLIDQSYSARVTWSAVNCSNVQYLVEITGRINDNPQSQMEIFSYWTQRRYFELPLPCSSVYSLTVSTKNSAGISEPSSKITGTTAPCTPLNVTYTGDNQSALVSWEASLFATHYTIFDVTGVKPIQVCNTTNLFCQLANVHQGTIELTASNSVGESLPTRDIRGPELNRSRRGLRNSEMMAHLQQGALIAFNNKLQVPEVQVKRVTGLSLYVEWKPVKDADYYTIIIKEYGVKRPTMVLTVDQEFSTFNDLKSSTKYCIVLSAKNTINYSSFSKPECITTGVSQ